MKNLIFPLAAVALVGACAPWPPYATNPPQPPAPGPLDVQPTLTDEEQRMIQENRERLAREKRERELAERNGGNPASNTSKPKYPTAAPVPGKAGYVFNPYTQGTVDVRGIAPGTLVRDPEDDDPSHKFRVP